MISSRSDYRFINQSSLNDIIINGGIMPLRSSSQKKILRGEDISFIIESEMERSYWWKSMNYVGGGSVDNVPYSKHVFNKSISDGQAEGQYGHYREMFSLNTGIKTTPSSEVIVKSIVPRTYSPEEAYDNIFVGNGYTLSESDYESLYMESSRLLAPFIIGRFNNISKMIACRPHTGFLSNRSIPYETVCTQGTKTSIVSGLWEAYSSSTEVLYGVCSSQRAIRVLFDGQNGDVISGAQLWAIGNGNELEVPAGTDINKSVAIKISDGSFVSEGTNTYIDFYIDVDVASVNRAILSCGMPIPSIHPTIERFYSFDFGYFVLAYFSNRSKW